MITTARKPPDPRRISTTRRMICALTLALIFGCGWVRPGSANWQEAPARQVVVFGVVAKPGGTEMDPKISKVVQAQLRRLLPNHGFRLIKIKSDRVVAGQGVRCDLNDGFVATAKLAVPLDPNGKIQMRFELSYDEVSQFQTIVTTPPDQFNFFDKSLPDGNRLLVGVGAR